MAHPQRLLEVTIHSAKDLPPISKLLHTFVVAWVNSETKIATRVDQHNNSNPIWNCKLVFRVDDKFLLSESSIVMMEIFNVAWLRDLPMGTTRLRIGQLLNNSQKNHTMHNIALPICRFSTGQVQGTLNVSVNVVGGYPTPTAPPVTGLHVPSNTSRSTPTNQKQESLLEKLEKLEMVCKPLEDKINPIKPPNMSFSRSNSVKDTTTTEAETSLVDSTMWNQQSEFDSKSRGIFSNDSLFPTLKPLPSDIASDFKKGCYYQSPESHKATNIFDNWTDPSEPEIKIFTSKSSRWGVVDQVNLFPKEGGEKKMKKNKPANEKGIMSCFGNACGFQCKLLCGSKNEKMKRKNKFESRRPVFRDSEQNLRKLYF